MHSYRVTLKREDLQDAFTIVQEKIYTDVTVSLDAFVRLENIINKNFRSSEFFVLKADIDVKHYIVYRSTFIDKNNDVTLARVVNYDNDIILKGPIEL